MRAPLLTTLLIAAMTACGNKAPTDSDQEITAQYVQGEAVQFQTVDGFQIRGTLFTSNAHQGARPVVILLHDFSLNHAVWTDFTPDLVVNRGFVALAFDLRGHGNSAFQNGQARPVQTFNPADLNQMPLDVEAAVAYLKTRPEADIARIGLIGTDIGANIAFISAGTLAEIKTTVSVSPQYRDNQAQQILIGTDIPGFVPRNILYLAAFGDGYAYTSAETMAAFTQGDAQVLGFQGLNHGIQLLATPEAWQAALSWLAAKL